MTSPDLYAEIDSLTHSEMRDVVLQFALGHRADYEAAVKIAHLLKQGAESRGNPYGSYPEAKHGRHDAASAAEVARELEPEREQARGAVRCPVCQAEPGELCVNTATGEPGESFVHGGRIATWKNRPKPAGHLPQHTHGQPGCTYPGCHDHDLPALTAVADASRLAGHMPEGAQ